MMTVMRSVGAMLTSALALFGLTGLLRDASFNTRKRPGFTLPDSVIPANMLPPVSRLRQYLQIRTDHPNPDYYGAAQFLNTTISLLLPNAEVSQIELVAGKPIVLVKIEGSDPSLPALLLNSHTDVVPAESSQWRWRPFAADLSFVNFEWRIYARGAQDMKSVGMQYLEALKELSDAGWVPKRNVFLTYVPDEEIGGKDGLGKLVGDGENDLWRSLNIGAEVDEGLPNPKPGFNIYFGERQTWWMVVEAEDSPGHGALSPDDTAAQKIHRVIARALKFRERERARVNESGKTIGDTIGVNVVFVENGIESEQSPTGYIMNIIPSKARAGFDIRVPPHVSTAQMENEIESWMLDENDLRCPGVSYYFTYKVENAQVTDSSHPFAKAFFQGLDEARKGAPGPEAIPSVFFGGTDARFVRRVGIPCIGFSPIEQTTDLLHKHDEYITVEGYLAGVTTYKHIIQHIADTWAADISFDVDDLLADADDTVKLNESLLASSTNRSLSEKEHSDEL